MALFKLIKDFEASLNRLETRKSKFFIIRAIDECRIKIIKERIRELREEVHLRKNQKNEDHK